MVLDGTKLSDIPLFENEEGNLVLTGSQGAHRVLAEAIQSREATQQPRLPTSGTYRGGRSYCRSLEGSRLAPAITPAATLRERDVLLLVPDK